MAQSKLLHEGCACYNPVLLYLAETLLTDEVIQQLSDSMRQTVDSSQPVSVMYTGGTIRPMIDGNVDTVDAIGFHDGKVVASGSEPEVATRMKQKGINYTTIKLSAGQTLLPGLIEPHVHIVPTALIMGWNDFGPFDKQDLRKDYNPHWLKDAIAGVKKKFQKGSDAWILGIGVDPSLMPFKPAEKGGLATLQRFCCKDVDELEEQVPVLMISASMHTAYVNTQALKQIYCSSLKIREKYDMFCKYEAHVNSDGGLQELEEIVPALFAIPKWQLLKTVLGVMNNLHCLFETANRRGVTLMYDAAMSPPLKIVLDIFFFKHSYNVRIGFAKLCESLKAAEEIVHYKPPTEFKNIYQGSIKVISDGSNQGLTGYQNETYCCEPRKNIGFFNFPAHSTPNKLTPKSEYILLMKTVIGKGWPMMIHANGNKAIDFTLEAYEDALAGGTGLTKRHRIEHCSLLSPENVVRLSKLGISPSFLIGHVGYWGYVFRKAIFEEKAEHQLDLCKSALDKGMRITLHSDNAVTPLGPLRMMEQAITRIMEGDLHHPDSKALNENEKISPEQALRAVTYDAAWQCHADQWVGSLEECKFADYVILAEDPITRENPVGMRDIPVLETWVGGTRVYNYN